MGQRYSGTFCMDEKKYSTVTEDFTALSTKMELDKLGTTHYWFEVGEAITDDKTRKVELERVTKDMFESIERIRWGNSV